MAEDWDNLIILDACRYDYFERLNTIDGTLYKAPSKGKKSWEFMRENFATGEFHDTVYVTANPFSTDLDAETFYHIDHLHADRWDEDIGTVQPDDVVSAAIAAHEQHPDKRLIVHFMQPHRPYLGETADKLRRRLDLQGYGKHDEGIQIWGAVKQRDVTFQEIRDAYTESLEIALGHVEELLEAVPGKSVVTADHGEMLGERVYPFTSRVWGHMEGFSTPTLREVPWLVIGADDRREIRSSDPIESERELDDDEITDRLEALGYAD
ncbi:hypothetical protein A6E15_03855 [Natrinema saccharevitans]|uniref:Sulfatase n=1 Tax=Natrinema saccharevitans TaxID=301967 RepID=A0A1S8AU74_9EURY|nr:hypothetical protein [Natrinema saccharevitans]OLZ40166.1 hypothetical protein A6E15_03855 [Natrinema saccharevitans]